MPAVLDPVFDQVVERLKQPLAVGKQGEIFRHAVFQLHLFFVGHLPQAIQHGLDELVNVHLALVEAGVAGLEV